MVYTLFMTMIPQLGVYARCPCPIIFFKKQVRSQRSLEMLLGVVEENRKKEVMENLGMCAQLVEKIKRELTELEGKAMYIVYT